MRWWLLSTVVSSGPAATRRGIMTRNNRAIATWDDNRLMSLCVVSFFVVVNKMTRNLDFLFLAPRVSSYWWMDGCRNDQNVISTYPNIMEKSKTNTNEFIRAWGEGRTCDMMPRAKLTKSRPSRSALFPPGNSSCFFVSLLKDIFFFFLSLSTSFSLVELVCFLFSKLLFYDGAT
jgi:hypothetical protein